MAVVTPQFAQLADSGLRCIIIMYCIIIYYYTIQAVPLIFTLVIVQDSFSVRFYSTAGCFFI